MSHVIRKPFYTLCEQQRRSLISTFIVRCLDSIIPLLAKAEISRLAIVCLAEQAGLSRTWSNPEDRFSHGMAQLYTKPSLQHYI